MADESTSDLRTGALVTVATLLGGAVKYLWDEWRKGIDKSKTEEATREKGVIERQQELIARLDHSLDQVTRERDRAEARIDSLTEEKHACQINTARMKLHIRYLERILTGNKLSYERYEDDSGSAIHKPLNTEGSPDGK